jgi:uncharacterized protein YndB with AHSA1/START domain
MLGLLRGGRHTVGELARNFRTTRPAISKRLRVLRSVGLVVTHHDGAAMNEIRADETVVQEITITAPAERISTALTDPAQAMQWWGAESRLQTTHMGSDLRPGSKCMMRGTGMGGKAFSVVGEYRSIARPRLLVVTWLPDWNANTRQSLVRFNLEEKGGVTTVRLTHSGLTSEAARAQRVARHSGVAARLCRGQMLVLGANWPL